MDNALDARNKRKIACHEEQILNHIAEATVLFQKGEYQNAVKAYTTCIQIIGDGNQRQHRTGIHYNRAVCYLKLKKYHKVLVDCNTVISLDPKYTKVYARKVKALCYLGRFIEAHKAAQKWMALAPENPQAKKEYDRLSIIVEAMLEEPDEDGLDDSALASPAVCSSGAPAEEEDEDEEEATFSNPSHGIGAAGTEPDRIRLPDDRGSGGEAFLEMVRESSTCTCCAASFESKSDLEKHMRSGLHPQNMAMEDDKQHWKHRPPPRGFTSREYTKCPRYFGEGTCRFGNRCSQAHSDAELAEWKDRFEKRKERLQSAKESDTQNSSWTEHLLKSWLNAENPEAVMVESLDGVSVHEGSDLTVRMPSKKCSHTWTFTITTKVCLRRVGLIDDTVNRHFHISSITIGRKKAQVSQTLEDHCQEWTNPTYVSTRNSVDRIYRIKVAFKTEIYGTLRQSLVFDFGSEPVLVRQLCVESTSVSDIDKVNQAIQIDQSGRWDVSSIKTQEFIPRPYQLDEDELNLFEKYPPPMVGKFAVSEVMLEPTLRPSTYKRRMHDLLYIEEMAQFSNIAKFNIKTTLHAVNRFMLMPSTVSVAKFAQDGELFAQLKLDSEISEDTAHGRLILQNVNTVYLAPYDPKKPDNDQEPKKIYEAVVEEKGKNFIFLRLSSQTVKDFKLRNDTEFPAQVQFQLNRLPLCEMHEAVDKMPDVNLVFPDLANMDQIPWNPQRQWSDKWDTRLNAKQKEAIVAITTGIKKHLPPILLVGPYGTGKTFTLAQATLQILQQEGTRVLICTHSNSAADLYVKDYLHSHVQDGHEEMRPLRIYYQKRWINTVNPTVFEYCLVSNRGTPLVQFRRPTKEDILNHRVIVCTLSIARYLYGIGLDRDCFSHILLDEAAQAMECETIMPLAMAGPNTRVVLAGDHMQLSPEVHSDFARDRNLHMSFLERMYDFYPDNNQCKILLCENYRSHKAIIEFTSELFYENKLVASGNQPMHDQLYPLTFYTARGEDLQHQNSTTFYNNAEVYEIVERVSELCKMWPKSWGPIEDNGIGIVSPYADQVVRIRAELRKKKLSSISVERVFNVQGKQFRVIFLSTVRTRHTCSSDSSLEELMDYGFLSNVKLLNTAITRAQSLVAVVGDPVSLCSIGKCRKLWERFLEICNKNKSLNGITWNILRSQLDGVELKKTYVLNPLAPEFVPNRLRHACYSAPEPVAFGKYGYTFTTQSGRQPWVARNGQYVHSQPHPSMYYGQPMFPMTFYPAYSPHVPRPLSWAQRNGNPLSSAAANLTGSPIKLPSPACSASTSKTNTNSNASTVSASGTVIPVSQAKQDLGETSRSSGNDPAISQDVAKASGPLVNQSSPGMAPAMPHPRLGYAPSGPRAPMPFFPPNSPVMHQLYAMPPAMILPPPLHRHSHHHQAPPGPQYNAPYLGAPIGPRHMASLGVHPFSQVPVPIQVSPVTSPVISQNQQSPLHAANGMAVGNGSDILDTATTTNVVSCSTSNTPSVTANNAESSLNGVQLLPTARNVTPENVNLKNETKIKIPASVENGFKMPFNIDKRLLIQNAFLQREVFTYIQQTQGHVAAQNFMQSVQSQQLSQQDKTHKQSYQSWSQVTEQTDPKTMHMSSAVTDQSIVSIGKKVKSRQEPVTVSVKMEQKEIRSEPSTASKDHEKPRPATYSSVLNQGRAHLPSTMAQPNVKQEWSPSGVKQEWSQVGIKQEFSKPVGQQQWPQVSVKLQEWTSAPLSRGSHPTALTSTSGSANHSATYTRTHSHSNPHSSGHLASQCQNDTRGQAHYEMTHNGLSHSYNANQPSSSEQNQRGEPTGVFSSAHGSSASWNSSEMLSDSELPVDRMVKYIENSLEEKHHESELGNIHIGHNSLRFAHSDGACAMAANEVHEPLYMRRGSNSSQTTRTLSYAGALRRVPPPVQDYNPVTTADPLDLLKNLNIKPSPGTQAFYQYFS